MDGAEQAAAPASPSSTPPFGARASEASTQQPASPVAELHVLRVFCDERGRGGNELGVFLDDPVVPAQLRQGIAARLGFSETVFVEDSATGRLRIHTPALELPFAGHPLVGAAWLLGRREPRAGRPRPASLNPPAGEIAFGEDGARTWVRARAEHSPPWTLVQLPDPPSVLALDGAPRDLGHAQAWAWEDERAGRVRARVFARDYGVHEDAATGSAAVVLCAALERELVIVQGPANARSEISVRPLGAGWVKLGGRVVSGRAPSIERVA